MVNQQKHKNTQKSTSSEDAKGKKKGTKKERKNMNFFETLKNETEQEINSILEFDIKKSNVGGLFAGIEKLHKSIKGIDNRVSGFANDVSSKVVDYINTSVTNYKKNG
jgi:hypothetical protein